MNAHRRAQPFVHQPPPQQQRAVGSGLQQHQQGGQQHAAGSRQQSTASLTFNQNQNQNGPIRSQPQQPQPQPQPHPSSPPIPTHDPTRKRSQFLADELFQPNNASNAQHSSQQQSQLQHPQSYLFRNDPPAPSFSNAAPAAARTNPPSFLNPPNPKPPQHQRPQDPSQWSLSDLLADILRDKDTVTIIDFLSTVIDHERLYDVTLVEDSFMNMLFQWTEENECADMPMSQEDLLLLLDQLKEVNEIKDDDDINAAHAQDQQLGDQQQQQQENGGGFVDQRFFTIMSPGTPAAKQFSTLTPAKQRMFMQIVTPLSMRKRGIHPPNRQPMFGGGASGIPKPTTFESRIPRPTAFGATGARPTAAGALQPHDQHPLQNQHDRQQPQWSNDPAAKESDNHQYTHNERAPSDIAITDHHPPLTDDFWLSDQAAPPPAFPPPAANDQHLPPQRVSPADQPDAPLRYHDLFGPDIPAPAEMDHAPAHQQKQPKYGLYTNDLTPDTNNLGTPAATTTLPTRADFLARGTAAERDLLLEYETQIQTLNHHVASLKAKVQEYKHELAEAAQHEAQIMTSIDDFHAHARKLKRKAQWYHDELKKVRAEVDEAVRREEALMGKVDELEREGREAREREAAMQEDYQQLVEEWRAVAAERDELQVMLHGARKDGPAADDAGTAAAAGRGSEMGGPTGSGGRQFADAGAGSMSLGAELISGTGAALLGNMDPDTALRMGRLEAENEHLRRQVNAQGGGGRNLIPKVHAEVQAGTSACGSEAAPVMCDAEVMVRPDRYPCGTQYMDPEKVAQWAEMGIIEDEPDTMVSGLHDLHDYEMGVEGFGGMPDFVDNEDGMGLSVVPEGEEDVDQDRMDEDESAVLPDPMSPTPVRVAGPSGSIGGRPSSLFGRHRPSPQPPAPSMPVPTSSLKPSSPRKSDKPTLMAQAGFDKTLSLRDRIKSLATRSALGKPGLWFMGLVALGFLGAVAAVLVHVILWPPHGGSEFGDLGPDFGDDMSGSHGPLIESSPVLDPGYYCLIGIRQRVEDMVDAAAGDEF